MAAMEPLHVDCPACGKPITIPMTATPGKRLDHQTVELVVSTDLQPARGHADRHLMRLRTAQVRYGWTPEQAADLPEHVLRELLDGTNEPEEG